jgi:N-acetylglucosamine kinase-like BadF-type ATPase
MTSFYASISGMELLLGVDAGGTGSRALLTAPDGSVRGTGRAGPGNPSAQRAQAAQAIGLAVRTAIGEHDPAAVSAAVVGVAGISGLADPRVAEAFDREWAAIGLTCPVRIVGDAVTAFAAGAREPGGVVLIAGTGAVAALIDGVRVVRNSDGLGWLLGDEGSGTWLGLQAVKAAAHHEGLTEEVFAAAGVTSSDALINWAGAQPPAAFAALAPMVCASPDPVARRILAEAVTRLLRTLDRLGAPAAPVVLAGSLLTANTPIRAGVLQALRSRGVPVGTADSPVAGAVRLAALAARAGVGSPP